MSALQSLNPSQALNQGLSFDPGQLDSLSSIARRDPKEGVRQVASQFEMLLMNKLLQGMRETKFSDDDDSNEMETFKGLLDQQLVQSMAGVGGVGLGKMLEREIAKLSHISLDDKGGAMSAQPALSGVQSAVTRALESFRQQTGRVLPADGTGAVAPAQPAAGGSEGFVRQVLPHAEKAAAMLGVDPRLIVSHAALESGWGKRAIRHPDGRDSYNLFGIKAGPGWQGEVVNTLTTEYSGGQARKQIETFRSYGSMAEAMEDYARLIGGNERYGAALNRGRDAVSYALALQRGGYATDPQYARKLIAVAGTLGI